MTWLLCLSIYEDFSVKINNRYFQGAKYNENSVWWTVEDFINKVKREAMTERFNLFLSTHQLKYLEKAAGEAGLNKSEYIRRFIEKDSWVKKITAGAFE